MCAAISLSRLKNLLADVPRERLSAPLGLGDGSAMFPPNFVSHSNRVYQELGNVALGKFFVTSEGPFVGTPFQYRETMQ